MVLFYIVPRVGVSSIITVNSSRLLYLKCNCYTMVIIQIDKIVKYTSTACKDFYYYQLPTEYVCLL